MQMAQLRIRTPFAVAFVIYTLAISYLGLTRPVFPQYGPHSDKGLHFVAFFILTTIFYWVLETSRRRVVHVTLVVCTAALSIGSEIAQALLPNNRIFDPFDILANVLGSTAALFLCSWYHKRMLERRRAGKHYDIVPGEELGEDTERDVELGEGVGAQETGTIVAEPGKTVTEELDTWDENAEDWDDGADTTADSKTAAEEPKRRAD